MLTKGSFKNIQEQDGYMLYKKFGSHMNNNINICLKSEKIFLQHKILKLDSHLPTKTCFICFNENPLKFMKATFYFILKAFFCSQDIQIFVLTFWS